MTSFYIISVLIACVAIRATSGATLNVNYDKPGHGISPNLWGIFFEEINHSGEGGLYAELIKNRVFAPKRPSIDGYGLVKSGSAAGQISLSEAEPLNDQVTRSLELRVDSAATGVNGERIGFSNTGFWGIPIRPDYTVYRASFYIKSSSSQSLFTGPLTLSIESEDESVVFASASIPNLIPTVGWQKYEVTLTPTPSLIQVPRKDTKFVISTTKAAANTTLFFNVISLFPPTFKNRPNGLRTDIAEKLAAAKPSFLRFPGGNFLEGNNIAERFIWEETLGDISTRPGHMGCWGYYSTDGLGLLEYLEFAQDLNAEIILGLFAGYALNGESVPPELMGPYIDSALNEIEYVIGNASTTWGARRIADGHPEPFPLTYVEIGNEDWFSTDYEIRYPLFYDAVRAKYPELKIISTQDVKSRPIMIRDDHFYPGFGWFPDNWRMYDNTPRDGPEVFVGEYACRDNINPRPEANTASAIDDAAFMAGIERNSDIVTLACYAPLLAHVDDLVWTPDGIYFDGLQSFANVAWWVQHMFSVYRGDTYIPTDTDANPNKIFHVAARNTQTNTLIVKIINTDVNDHFIDTVQLHGVSQVKAGRMTMLTGGRWEVNDLENPLRIAPQTSPFNLNATSFSFNAPSFSLTVFEFEL